MCRQGHHLLDQFLLDQLTRAVLRFVRDRDSKRSYSDSSECGKIRRGACCTRLTCDTHTYTSPGASDATCPSTTNIQGLIGGTWCNRHCA